MQIITFLPTILFQGHAPFEKDLQNKDLFELWDLDHSADLEVRCNMFDVIRNILSTNSVLTDEHQSLRPTGLVCPSPSRWLKFHSR